MSASRGHEPAVLVDLDSLDSLHEWIASTRLGAVATWHTGDLAVDRRRDPHVDAMARAVSELARAGLCRAFAVELRPSLFVYRVTRSTSPLPGKLPR